MKRRSRHEIEIQISQEVAERHIENLVGFVTVGYDSPGYGYGEKDKMGVPILKKMIGELAAKYDLPFLVDYASGLPVSDSRPKI